MSNLNFAYRQLICLLATIIVAEAGVHILDVDRTSSIVTVEAQETQYGEVHTGDITDVDSNGESEEILTEVYIVNIDGYAVLTYANASLFMEDAAGRYLLYKDNLALRIEVVGYSESGGEFYKLCDDANGVEYLLTIYDGQASIVQSTYRGAEG